MKRIYIKDKEEIIVLLKAMGIAFLLVGMIAFAVLGCLYGFDKAHEIFFERGIIGVVKIAHCIFFFMLPGVTTYVLCLIVGGDIGFGSKEEIKTMKKYSKLTQFAENCVYAHERAIQLMCISEEMAKDEIAQEYKDSGDESLILEISKEFAKYTKENITIDLDIGEVEETVIMLNAIIECCEKHNWFEDE